MRDFIEETVEPDDIDLKSFDVNDELNPNFWDDDMRLDQNIRKSLLLIAKDFIDYCELGDYDIDDVVITGSIANYNWNKDYSDIDLHIVMDTSEIADDASIAKNFCTFAKNLWNKNHTDVSVAGFPVEVYIQDSSEVHKSTGVYSLLDDKWIKKPSIENMTPEYDDSDVQKSAAYFMNKIDDLLDKQNDIDPAKLYGKACNLMDEIKSTRSNSLSKAKNPELSTGNIVFKTLRRTDYIEKLVDLKSKLIDKMLSYDI